MLDYSSHSYEEAMAMQTDVSHIFYATSSKEKTGDIIMFTQFEEGDLLSETCDDTEISSESDDD